MAGEYISGGSIYGPDGNWLGYAPEPAAPFYAAATPGARLIDPKYDNPGQSWGNTSVDGGTAYKWMSPSGQQATMVMTPNGPMLQLPADAVDTSTTDSSAGMGALGQIGSLFSGPIGMAAGAAFLPGLTDALGGLGGGAGSAGLDIGSGLLDANQGLTSQLMSGTGATAGLPYGPMPDGSNLGEFLPSGGIPTGPMDNGLNLGDYNLNGNGVDFGPSLPGSTSTGSQFNPNGFNEPAIDVNTGLPATANPGAGISGNVYGAATGATGLASMLRSAGILGTDTSNDSMIDAAGRAVPGLLGAYAASNQANAISNLANQQLAYGAPSRSRYEASMTSGFDPSSIPGYQGAVDNSMNAMLRKLSTSGNPFGNPGGLIEANKSVVAGTALPALQEYQRLNANTGFGNTMNAANNLQTGAIQANSNIYGGLGDAAASVFNPKTSLADLLKGVKGVLP